MDAALAPRLLGEIDGAEARFAIERVPGRRSERRTLRCADHPDLLSALRHYLQAVPDAPRIRLAAIALANPVDGDELRLTNHPWAFSSDALRQALALDTLVVVNDFTALAMSLPRLRADAVRSLGGGLDARARPQQVLGLVGAGAGLGLSGLIPIGDDAWVSLASEGGHAPFAPGNAAELRLLQRAWLAFEPVSNERLVSGPGLELVHRALADEAGVAVPDGLRWEAIVDAAWRAQAAASHGDLAHREALPGALAHRSALPSDALAHRGDLPNDALAHRAVARFGELLGSVAAQAAVTLGAYGGVYLAGPVVRRMGALLDASGFRARFEHVDRHGPLMARIPTFVVTADDATLVGASAILDAQLRGQGRGAPLLARVRSARSALSAAERSVADWVLAQPRRALAAPIGEIARAAGVSQPTVVRFCRSVGCAGLSDFKLKLAPGLSGTIPVAHSTVPKAAVPAAGADAELATAGEATDATIVAAARGAPHAEAAAASPRAHAVLTEAAAAVLALRDGLDAEALQAAAALLRAARRIEIHAIGDEALVGREAQFILLGAGLPATACGDRRMLPLTAQALQPGDVVLAIGSAARTPELLQAAEVARARGAHVIALAPAGSALARKASVSLPVDAAGSPSVGAGRLLVLALIDALAAVVRDVGHERSADPAAGPTTLGPAPPARRARLTEEG
jgi:glucokinase